jgi:hypothetical protein
MAKLDSIQSPTPDQPAAIDGVVAAAPSGRHALVVTAA